MASFDPSKDDVFGSRVWFDLHNQQIRLDIDIEVVNNNMTHNRLSLLFNYVKQKLYHITYINMVANCTILPLTEPIEPACLSKKAEHRGTALIGGVLKAENYIERHDKDKHRIVNDILFIDNINVPLRSTRRHEDGTMSFTEFWNFEEKVHHDAFVVPSVCQHKADEDVYVQFSSASETIKYLVPQVKYNAIFN